MSPTPTIAVLHTDTPPAALHRLHHQAHLRPTTPDQLAGTLPEAEILLVWDFRTDALADAWQHATKLRWIHAASAGVDQLLFPALAHSTVHLTNSRGIFDQPIAEYVLACVLAFAKDIPATVRLQDRTEWRHRETERITGAHATIVGTGPIGRAIARLLRAAGMRVTGIGRRARDNDPDFGPVHHASELVSHSQICDYLVLAAPLTAETTGLVNAETLAALPAHARLINVGRGELINEPDLVAALKNDRLAGAALDVFSTEPLPSDSALWTMPNVLISPHMSGDTTGWCEQLIELFADNLTQWQRHAPLHNVVNKQRGYVTDDPAAPA